MFKSLQRLQYGLHHTLCIYLNHNPVLLQRPFISLVHHFTESSIQNNNESIEHQLPDPHALVTDPNDPSGKVRYNMDNVEEEDINVTDEQFVDGMIVALEEWCPEVNDINGEERVNMVKFVENNKNNRLNQSAVF